MTNANHALGARLRERESHNVTFFTRDFPVFWESARGATVRDAGGKEYLDLTSAFGVANVGHANPRVVAAAARQARRLVHGMGDVHPSEVRVRLLERLCEIAPAPLEKAFLATTGSEAVEAAMKTAVLATGKSHFAAFRGAYHGLSLGTLAVGGIERFKTPFAGALGPQALLLEYPDADVVDAETAARATHDALARRDDVAAVLVEPIQGRAGCIVPPAGYLMALREICDTLGILMIADEIYTGFGRTGEWFAVNRERVVPDLLCIGKAMGGGFPVSAVLGSARVMDAWPLTQGEALHTSTYLGHPVACAAALATLDELQRRRLPERAARLGESLGRRLRRLAAHPAVLCVRGRGLLWGVRLRDAAAAWSVVERSLGAGVILLQSGLGGDVLTIAPPLVISARDLRRAMDVLEGAVEAAG